ncbi:MAG: hypothetical protein A2Z32_04185 [Chloroflexi bacterium RBG_16_69_14]|nr:MAG: hypothetical protein A2Z32_04185 [Chloroflexi bacterium RBG_16_69_14]
MAPGPNVGLYVSVPRPGGSVLALLDDGGRPRPGWPIAVRDSTSCGLLLPLADGSVRAICTLDNPDRNMSVPVAAFAFDANGRLLAGWPVDFGAHSVDGYSAGRVVGDELIVFAWAEPGAETNARDTWIMTIAANGAVRNGTPVRVDYDSIDRWVVGPDGVAYGSIHPFGEDFAPPTSSELFAVSVAGIRVAFPVAIDGLASGAAFDAAGLVHMAVNTPYEQHARTLVLDPDGRTAHGGSGDLEILATSECTGIEGSCEFPAAPLVGADGSTFVIGTSWDDTTGAFHYRTTVAGLSPSGQMMAGWPYGSDGGSQTTGYIAPGDVDGDFKFAAPAIGPDNVLYLIHSAKDPSVGGGSIVAVGRDGKVRPGWPVELKRPGAEFWSVVVGPEGTTYALAIEPESGDKSSASILAIAPDSTVRWTTTIVEP